MLGGRRLRVQVAHDGEVVLEPVAAVEGEQRFGVLDCQPVGRVVDELVQRLVGELGERRREVLYQVLRAV